MGVHGPETRLRWRTIGELLSATQQAARVGQRREELHESVVHNLYSMPIDGLDET